MKDDFSALDLLSIGGFRISSGPVEPVAAKPKSKFGFGRRQPKGKRGFKRGLTGGLTLLLPFLAGKVGRRRDKLQGWPVTLSWPQGDVPNHDSCFEYEQI